MREHALQPHDERLTERGLTIAGHRSHYVLTVKDALET